MKLFFTRFGIVALLFVAMFFGVKPVQAIPDPCAAFNAPDQQTCVINASIETGIKCKWVPLAGEAIDPDTDCTLIEDEGICINTRTPPPQENRSCVWYEENDPQCTNFAIIPFQEGPAINGRCVAGEPLPTIEINCTPLNAQTCVIEPNISQCLWDGIVQKCVKRGTNTEHPGVYREKYFDQIEQNKISTKVAKLNLLKANSVPALIGDLLKILMGVLGTVALLIITYGGVIWMTSDGNASREKEALGIVVWAILGIILILSSYAIVKFIIENAF
jgi:hypothetical protein